MIVKILKGRSFSGLLDYLFNPQDKPPPQEIEARDSPESQYVSEEPPSPESSSRGTDRAGPSKEMSPDACRENQQRGDLLITNMAGRSKEELLEHFEALAALRPDVEVNVLHAIISMPKEDVLSRGAKARIVMRFVELKGLDRTMYAAIEHDDHHHTEIHIAASTINFKGKLPSDSFDYDKGESIARQLEKEFGLKPNRSSRDSMQRAPTQGEWKQHERTGKLSRPLRLQAIVNSALNREVTFTEFKERLNRRGVGLSLIVSDEGTVVGSVYRFEEKHIRGRRLGRGYTWPGLQRDWPDQQERKGRMNYEPERDHAALSRARGSAMGRGDTNKSGESQRLVGAVRRGGEATERVKRPAGTDREPTHQTLTVGEESRGAIRDNRARGKGTARGDRAAQEEHSDKSQPVQHASDGDRKSGQRRVPTPAQDSSGIFRRDDEDKRQERADGGTMSGDGSDEQRYLQQGQRGSTGSIREDPGASKGRSRGTLQTDRDAGAALQDDLPKAEQVNRHRDDSHSPLRLRRRSDDRRDVDSNEATPSRGNPSLNSAMSIKSQEDSNTHSMAGHRVQSTDSKTSAVPQISAVDEVVKTLWNNSSSFEGVADQSATVLKQRGGTKGKENNRKELEVAIPEGVSNREELSVRNRAPLEIGKDQADSLPSQKLSQDKQTTYTDRSISGGHGHSR